MRIELLGTGALVSKSFSACALIDDTILFDCPNGLVRVLRQKDIDFSRIKTIIISHYHADHDWDLPFLFWEYSRVKRQEPLKIIAPKGFMERFKPICDMLWTDMFSLDTVMQNVNLKIIETADKKVFDLDGYKITAYKVEHSNCDAYGYRIQKGEKVIAMTGDATMCDSVNELVKNANLAFVDVTTISNGKPVHFDMPDFEILKSNHKSVKILPIHMSQDAFNTLKERGHNPPSDNDVFEV